MTKNRFYPNTNDHLRNHGFLLQNDGWKLSPAYDMNPNPTRTRLHLNLSESVNSLSLDLALSVAEFFRIDDTDATTIVDEVVAGVREWEAVAKSQGISRQEITNLRPAFRAAESN